MFVYEIYSMKIIFTITLLVISFCGFSQKFTFVFLNKKPDAEKIGPEESKKIMEGHMANINRLASEGKLISAGPFEGGGGIFILNTTSLEEARKWLDTDPGVQARRWDIELLPYTPRIGSACSLSPPYEMVKYTFVRFDAIVSKPTAPTFPAIIKKHDAYLSQLAATGNVVTEGIFGDTDGGILVMKGAVQREVIEADPGIQEGLLEFQIKELHIAKGAFCEK
jgi:uncharacterized protein YciI